MKFEELKKKVEQHILPSLKDVGVKERNSWRNKIRYSKNEEDLDYNITKLNEKISVGDVIKLILQDDEIDNFEEGILNWIQKPYHNTWKKCKIKAKSIFKNSKQEDFDPLFIAHDKDEIIGKPQLIKEVYQNIKLVSKIGRWNKDEEKMDYSLRFLDDKYDKRFAGEETDTLIEEFLIYKVNHQGREHILLSKDKLGPEVYRFSGMKIVMQDLAEISSTFKINSTANLFIVRNYESSIKSMRAEELVEFTKSWKEEYNLDYDNFMDFFFYHPQTERIYRHTPEYEMMRIAQVFSSKFEGYPLHNLVIGPAGTGKTMELECIDALYKEEKGICEAGNSTPKVLIPSFKEKPANQGYVIGCNHMALVDELSKMIENVNQLDHDNTTARNNLSQLNSILEHKNRTIGSGNNNTFTMEATSKVIICTNPVGKLNNLFQHLDIIDKTTLSRFLIWVQDEKEIKFRQSNLPKIPAVSEERYIQKIKLHHISYLSPPKDDWASLALSLKNLKIFDPKFINLPFTLLKQSHSKSVQKIPDGLKYLWSIRGLHHMVLLLDGLIKFRCLFRDYDPTFTPIDEDFEWLDKIIDRMIEGWTYNFGMISEQDIFKGVEQI